MPGRAKMAAHPEISVEGDVAHVGLAAPDIRESRFRFRLASRYLIVWEDGSAHGQHYFVILPRPVDKTSDRHHVSFANGVVDARIHLARHASRRRPQ